MNRTQRGKFITVEGSEGAGKSTQIGHLCTCLEQAGLTVVQTREPGGTELGEEIRNILLTPRAQGMAADTELLLMFAARAEHLHRVIVPALDSGSWVVCDRFTDATYAYQGGGRGVADERVAVLEAYVQGELRPDCTLLLDLDPNEGLQRAKQRGAPDRFELEQIAFFERVRAKYLQQASQAPNRYRVLDASRPIEQVQQEVSRIVEELLRQ